MPRTKVIHRAKTGKKQRFKMTYNARFYAELMFTSSFSDNKMLVLSLTMLDN